MTNFQLTKAQIDQFERDGFLGPFEAFANDAIIDRVKERLERMVRKQEVHPLYGRFSTRDWHLQDEDLLSIFCHPAIVDRLRSLAGDDLVLWRSKVFLKKPAEDELGWHQEWGYFDGEEIGNHTPSLLPKLPEEDHWWNLSVWVAFNDITPEMGPVRFLKGSHETRYPWKMVPLTESAFFHDPFHEIKTKDTLVRLTQESKLILDINTRNLLDGVDVAGMSYEQLKTYIMSELAKHEAKVTLPFESPAEQLVEMVMKKGQFFIFSERCMHGSKDNSSLNNRLGVNCRVTTSDTLIYPGRLEGDMIDGSNLDITHHQCILLSGKALETRNDYRPVRLPIDSTVEVG